MARRTMRGLVIGTAAAVGAGSALVGMGMLAGCHSPGGPGYSADRYTFESHEWQPYTVTLLDTRTGETVWSVDVPVGQQLVLGFRKGTGPNEFKPDMMEWELMPAGRRFGTRNNQMPVPPAQARRIEPSLRPTPEQPGSPMPGPRMVRENGQAPSTVVPPVVPVNPEIGR